MHSLLALFFATAWPHARSLARWLSLFGIALGVALGYAVHLINRAAVEELSAAVRTLGGEADLEVRAARSGFDESVFAAVVRTAGVAAAAPLLELEVGLAERRQAVRLLGIDPFRSAQFNPRLSLQAPANGAGAGYGLLAPDTVVLSAAAARSLGLRAGGTLRLVSGSRAVELEVLGVLPESALGGSVAVADIATVQWRFARIGQLNRIAVRAAAGEPVERLRARIAARLPAGTHVGTLQESIAASANPSRAYRVNLNALALVALFTGGFLVFSSEALQVARRRREHALLRVLGLERRGIARLVMLEAGAIGFAGSALGVVLGYGLAVIAVAYSGGDLGAGLLPSGGLQLKLDAAGALGYLLGGILVALAGALLPASEAARRAPAQALKAGDEQAAYARPIAVWPALMLLLGAALLVPLPAIHGLPLFGYGAIACLLLGAIALMPRLLQSLLAACPLPPQVPAALALAQLRGAPGQAMVSLASIVASFSLMVAMAIMVGSFRMSVSEWLDVVLPADLYVRSTHSGDAAQLDAGVAKSIAALPHFARVQFLRGTRIALDPARPAVSLIGRDAPAAGLEQSFPLVGPGYRRRADDPPAVLASEAMADLYGFRPGARVRLPLGGATREFVVTGVFRDYARQHGAVLMDRATYIALSGDEAVSDASLWLAPGVSAAEAVQAVRELPGGDALEIASPGELRELSLRIFDRSFAITYALEAVAVLIGLFGLSSSLGAIVLARRREFGMLRHIGLSRAQIGRMLGVEGALLAALGAAAGLATGFVISLILVQVVNRQSFNWGMDLHIPYMLLGSLTASMIALGALSAYVSGREAMGQGPVRAVREDW